MQVGLDGYYKTAQQQLDDGLFGQSLILSSFNYSQGRVYGVEFTGSYTAGGFSAYANVAYSVAQGKGASSAQFLWRRPGNGADYVNTHWIYLDHDQTCDRLIRRRLTPGKKPSAPARVFIWTPSMAAD